MGWSASEYNGFIYLKGTGLGEDNGNALFNGPCRVVGIKAKLEDATVHFLKLYDDLAPTKGTTAPEFCSPVQKGDATIWGGIDLDFPGNPLLFENGLSVVGSDTAGTGANADPTNMDAVLIILPGAA